MAWPYSTGTSTALGHPNEVVMLVSVLKWQNFWMQKCCSSSHRSPQVLGGADAPRLLILHARRSNDVTKSPIKRIPAALPGRGIYYDPPMPRCAITTVFCDERGASKYAAGWALRCESSLVSTSLTTMQVRPNPQTGQSGVCNRNGKEDGRKNCQPCHQFGANHAR